MRPVSVGRLLPCTCGVMLFARAPVREFSGLPARLPSTSSCAAKVALENAVRAPWYRCAGMPLTKARASAAPLTSTCSGPSAMSDQLRRVRVAVQEALHFLEQPEFRPGRAAAFGAHVRGAHRILTLELMHRL